MMHKGSDRLPADDSVDLPLANCLPSLKNCTRSPALQVSHDEPARGSNTHPDIPLITELMVSNKNGPSGSGAIPIFRASTACRSCRLRKVKCDAQLLDTGQSCSPCQRAGQECLLDPMTDGRRSVSWKYVDELLQRIQTLEALVQKEGDRSDTTSRDTNQRDIANEATSVSTQRLSPSPGVDGRLPPHAGEQRRNSSMHSTAEHRPPPWSTSENGGPQQGKASRDLSGFLGSTSHPHLASPVDPPLPSSVDEPEEPRIPVDPDASQLRNHLIQSFFKYQTLWVEVVDRETFVAHRSRGSPSRWYCDFLECAILACATRLATSTTVRALGGDYVRLAKSEILSALHEPTPATLQACLLLSEYEATQGNERAGWMFCGIACRMLSDLGLHELAACTPTPGEATAASAKESDLAYALLSACIVYEGVWTLYLGRPSSISKSIMSIAASRCQAKRRTDSPLLNAWLGLCVPMAEICHILNDSQLAPDSEASSSLPRLIQQVQDWYDNLGPELTYKDSRLTDLDMAGYGLHTQYCKVQILLRQALERPSGTSRKRRFSQVSGDAIPEQNLEESKESIYQYSLRIARLVVTYRLVFGVEKIPSIMLDNAIVAATALIQHQDQRQNIQAVQQLDLVWIRSLIKSLEAVQLHFPITKRMLSTLQHMSEGIPFSSPLFHAPLPAPCNNFEAPICDFPISSHIESPISEPNLLHGPNVPAVLAPEDSLLASLGMDGGPNAILWGEMNNLFSGIPSLMPVFSSGIPQHNK